MTCFAFISSMDSSAWGGSEELWAQTAVELVRRGFDVGASVKKWDHDHTRIEDLERSGVSIWRRSAGQGLIKRITRRILPPARSADMESACRWLNSQDPALVVFSNGCALPSITLAELCVELGHPFVNIAQANHDDWWPGDHMAQRYLAALSKAKRCYFVSKANLELTELQLGAQLQNAELVRNPFNVNWNAAPAWPNGSSEGLKFACVARFDGPAKGHHLLFQALALEPWTSRSWRLCLFGDGPHKEIFRSLVNRFGLAERVEFRGHVSDVEEIWKTNHLLVLPSRYEGLPLALVEAALCGRPALATNIAGNGEIIVDGVTGFLAESPTVAALLRALEAAWESRGRLEQIGLEAGRRVRTVIPEDPIRVFADKLTSLVEHQT